MMIFIYTSDATRAMNKYAKGAIMNLFIYIMMELVALSDWVEKLADRD